MADEVAPQPEQMTLPFPGITDNTPAANAAPANGATPDPKKQAPSNKESAPPAQDGGLGGSKFLSNEVADTLTKALEQSGPGATDPAKPLKIDTIFLLTDGTPTVGSFTDIDPILKRVRTLNPFGRVRIHAIGVGEHNAVFMRRLAAENGGRFIDRNKESW